MKLTEVLIGSRARFEQYKVFVGEVPVYDYKLSENTLYLLEGEEETAITLAELVNYIEDQDIVIDDVILARELDYEPFVEVEYTAIRLSMTEWLGDKVTLK